MGITARLALAGLALGVASANPMANGTVYTTEVVDTYVTYCPEPTELTLGGKTYTITEARTVTITNCGCTVTKPIKPTATATGDVCAEGCMNVYNKCRTAKGANMAYCASQYANCLGYNPFAHDGAYVTPTACSTKPTGTPPVKDIVYTTEVVTAITTYCPEPTTLVYNNRTIHVTSPGTVTVTDCPCTIRHPQPTGPAAEPGCAAKCNDAYNKCRTAPGANMSYCASQYASCLGYNPFGNDGSFVTPTACSAGAKPTTAPPAAGETKPGQPGQPGQPKPTTGAPANTPAPVPAGAGRVAPAGVALALGALAFL